MANPLKRPSKGIDPKARVRVAKRDRFGNVSEMDVKLGNQKKARRIKLSVFERTKIKFKARRDILLGKKRNKR